MRPSLAALLAVACVAAACSRDATEPLPPEETEWVSRQRPWLPGERDSLIDYIIRTRQLALPYVGDLSDYAPFLLHPDYKVELVPNPVLAARRATSIPGVMALGASVPGTGWTTAGVDIRTINNAQSPPDTLDLLGWFWWRDTDSTQKGFVFIATAANTVGATTVNTPAFDASGAQSGAGGGEVQGGTFWQANGWTRRNQARVTLNLAIGAVTTVTTGPFLGGTTQVTLMAGNVDSVRLDRMAGTGLPVTQYASASWGLVGGVRLTCVFPVPCSTNALREQPGALTTRTSAR